jgi:N-methylhydantoinase A
MPGALSALGILMADVVRDYSRTVMLPPFAETLELHFNELEARGEKELAAEGLRGISTRSADLRYVGQGYELNVPFTPNLLSSFHQLHQMRYGYAAPEKSVEVVNVRVRLTAATTPVELPSQPLVLGDGHQALRKKHRIFFEQSWRESNVYDRDLLLPGDQFAGPALITEYSSTTVLPPGWKARVDCYRNLILEVG